MLKNGTYQITGYDHPVKFVTIALIFCYESPDSVVTKPLLRAFVLSICYESQTRKNVTRCNIPEKECQRLTFGFSYLGLPQF